MSNNFNIRPAHPGEAGLVLEFLDEKALKQFAKTK